jgi:YD repeat-containing protein
MKNILGKHEDLELFNDKGKKVYKYYKNSDGFWSEYTYDEKGNMLTCKDSAGDWREYTYDKKGNILTYKDSDSVWYEYTYDEKGNELTYRNSAGKTRGFDTPEYTMEELVNKLGNFKLIK